MSRAGARPGELPSGLLSRTRRRVVARAAAVLAALCFAALPAAAADRVLLAVGSNRGLPHDRPLAYGVSDAESFATLMAELGNVPADRVHLLRDPDAAALEMKLLELERSVGSGATLFFYYSGHGSETELHLSGDRFSRARLQGMLQRTRAALRVMVLDACRGLTERGAYAKAAPFRVVRSREQAGLVVIQSASRGEPALESGRLEGGLFTHHLISGLRGAADASGNGWVSLAEAYSFAYAHTVADSGWDQSPAWVLDLQGTGPLELTAVARARAKLVFPQGGAARYSVYIKGSQEQFASAWSSPTRETTLAVPRGPLVIWRRAPEGDGVAEVDLTFEGAERLSTEDFRPISRASMLARGGEVSARPHRLGAEAGVGYSLDRSDLRPVVGVRYTWEQALGGWSPSVGLTSSRGEFRTDNNLAERTYLQGFVGIMTPGWRLGVLQVRAGAGLTPAWVQQRLRSPDEDRTERAWSWGAQGRLSAGVPMGHRSTWDLSLIAQASALREQTTGVPTSASEAPSLPNSSARTSVEGEVRVTAGLTFAL